METTRKDGESSTQKAAWEWFDNTTIQEYQTCPKKCYLKYQKHYRSRKPKSPLEFGRAYHKAKELLLLGKDGEIAELVKSYEAPAEEDLRTRSKLEKLINTYKAERFPPKWDETLMIEEPISLDIGGYHFIVKPDTVIKWRGGVYGYESKHTAYKLYSHYFESFGRSSQVDAQMLGIKEKMGECLGIYGEVAVVRKGGPTSKLKEIEFLTDIITRTPQELKKAKEYFKDWMDTIVADTKFLENRKSCFTFGSPCEFLPLCTGYIDNPDEHYKIEPWDPRNKEEE